MRIITRYATAHEERYCQHPEIQAMQNHVIRRFLRADLPYDPMDTDEVQAHYALRDAIRHGKEAFGYYIYEDVFERIEWDMALNDGHTELTVDVFVQFKEA